MTWLRKNEDGSIKRYRVVVDCSNDDLITEQSHKEEVNINNIVRRHGIDLIAKTAMLQSSDYQFDDVTGNDFQEAMQKVAKATQSFQNMPSELRKRFDNSPAKFLDFVQNPDNIDEVVNMGLAKRRPEIQPIEVAVVNQSPENPETPTADTV